MAMHAYNHANVISIYYKKTLYTRYGEVLCAKTSESGRKPTSTRLLKMRYRNAVRNLRDGDNQTIKPCKYTGVV